MGFMEDVTPYVYWKPGALESALRRRLRRLGIMENEEVRTKNGMRLRADVQVGRDKRPLMTGMHESGNDALAELGDLAVEAGAVRARRRRAVARPVRRPHVPVFEEDPRTLAERADDTRAERERVEAEREAERKAGEQERQKAAEQAAAERDARRGNN